MIDIKITGIASKNDKTCIYFSVIRDNIEYLWSDIVDLKDENFQDYFDRKKADYITEFERQKALWEKSGKIKIFSDFEGEEREIPVSLTEFLEPMTPIYDRIKDKRKKNIENGIVYSEDIPYKTDEISMMYLLGACNIYPDEQQLSWKCADDVFRSITIADLKKALILCSDFIETMYNEEKDAYNNLNIA